MFLELQIFRRSKVWIKYKNQFEKKITKKITIALKLKHINIF